MLIVELCGLSMICGDGSFAGSKLGSVLAADGSTTSALFSAGLPKWFTLIDRCSFLFTKKGIAMLFSYIKHMVVASIKPDFEVFVMIFQLSHRFFPINVHMLKRDLMALAVSASCPSCTFSLIEFPIVHECAFCVYMHAFCCHDPTFLEVITDSVLDA
jgi:hypothetical protein